MKISGGKITGGAFNAGEFPRIMTPNYNILVPGVDRLAEMPMLIYGWAPDPMLRYKGGDAGATWAPWNYGTTLTRAGSPVLNQGSPYLGTNDDSVQFVVGASYAAGDATGDTGTEDLVVEAIVKMCPTTDNRRIAGTYASTGWYIGANSGTIPWFLLKDAVSGSFTSVLGASTVLNAVVHVLLFADRSGSAQWYVNGVVSGGATSIALRSATMADPTHRFNIGAVGDSFTGSVLYLATWQRQDWLDTHLQATVAANRFAALTATRPLYSYSGIQAPTAKGSTSASYQRKTTAGVTTLNLMGAGTPRFERVTDALGRTFVGQRVEAAAQNYCVQSENFQLSWVALTSISFPVTAVPCPNNQTLTTVTLHEGLAADGDVTHTTQGLTTAALPAGPVVWSCYAKAVNRFWFRPQMVGTATHNCYFNVTAGAGAVGAAPINCTQGMTYLGNGWYRCWMTFTALNEAHSHYISIAEGDGDYTFVGANQDSVAIFGVQIEVGSYPSSYYPTTTTALTRAADSNYYTLPAGTLSDTEGALYFEFLAPVLVPTSITYLVTVTNVATNDIRVYLDVNGRVTVYSVIGGVSVVESSGTRYDNTVHRVLVTWAANNIKLYVDNVLIGIDVTFTVPSGLIKYTMGLSSSFNSGPVLVSNVQVFNTSTRYRIVGN